MPVINGGGTGGVSTATVRLTHAQILALPTTAIQIAPAPTATQLIVPMVAVAALDPWHADYTNINASSLIGVTYTSVIAEGGGVPSLLSYGDESKVGFTGVSPLLADGANSIVTFPVRGTVSGSLTYTNGNDAPTQPWTTAFVGKGLVLFVDNGVSGNFTGGNAADSLLVAVHYFVIGT